MSRKRAPLMALLILVLLAAMWGGLLRLGWQWPSLRPTLPAVHGPLVALGRRWAYLGPLLSGLGALLMIVGGSGKGGPLLMTLGSLGLVAAFVFIIRRQPALFTVTMGPARWSGWWATGCGWPGGPSLSINQGFWLFSTRS